jgi:hypothetical protein
MTKTELNKSVDKPVKAICLTCKNKNRHKVLTSVDINGSQEMEHDEWYYWNNSFQIIECQGCGAISFRSEHSNSEEQDEGGTIVTELIYPKRTSDTWNSKDFFNIPYNLRRIYRETIDCFNNENLTLCGAGVRALVEGLCNENGILDGEIDVPGPNGTTVKKRESNLQGRINGLYEKGRLTKESAAILHEHRFLGNKAIHELSPPSIQELSLALEIVEHVFDDLYEIPVKGMQLQNRRLKKRF